MADRRSGVTTTGSATVQAVPDVVTATIGAHVRAADVQAALARANEALTAMRASLLADGVDASDLRTESTNVWRDDGVGRGDGESPSVVVRLTLRALVRDIAAAGGAVHRALEAAGDAAQLDALTFGITDPGPAATQARDAAFADARIKAEQFAAAAGRTLGKVVEITDLVAAPPVPRPLAMRAVAAESVLPIDAGEQAVPAEVRVRWSWAHE